MKSKYIFILTIVLVSVGEFGCRKWIKVEAPVNNYSRDNVYQDDGTAISVLTGIYTSMAGTLFQGTFVTGLKVFR